MTQVHNCTDKNATSQTDNSDKNTPTQILIISYLALYPQAPRHGSWHFCWIQALLLAHSAFITHSGLQLGGLPIYLKTKTFIPSTYTVDVNIIASIKMRNIFCNPSQYWTFLYCSPFSSRCDSNSWRSYKPLKALAKSIGNLIAIAFKSERERRQLLPSRQLEER